MEHFLDFSKKNNCVVPTARHFAPQNARTSNARPYDGIYPINGNLSVVPLIFFQVNLVVGHLDAVFFQAAFLSVQAAEGEVLG